MKDSVYSGQSKIQSFDPQDSFNLLEDHLRRLTRVLKDSNVSQDRAHVLRWVHDILITLGLRDRSIDLCLILVDNLLYLQNFQPECLETFCIGCVLFVIKLEGDFSPQLVEFINALDTIFHINPNSILQEEVVILQRLPVNFLSMATFTDALQCIFSDIPTYRSQSGVLKAVRASVVSLLINGHGCLELDHLIIFPTAVAIYNTRDISILTRLLASDLKGNSIFARVKPLRLNDFLNQRLI